MNLDDQPLCRKASIFIAASLGIPLFVGLLLVPILAVIALFFSSWQAMLFITIGVLVVCVGLDYGLRWTRRRSKCQKTSAGRS